MPFCLPQNKTIRLTTIIVSLIYLMFTSLVGATETVICIDEEKAHVLVKEDLDLRACHSASTDLSEKSHQPLFFLTSKETNQRSCIDIYLNSCVPSIFSHQANKLLSKKTQDTLVFTGNPVFIENLSRIGLKTHPTTYPIISTSTFLQTVVLLIWYSFSTSKFISCHCNK